MPLSDLPNFIVRAKAATYVGGGQKCAPCRPGSHDLRFEQGEWTYLDSYFGGTDFTGQEVVWYAGSPVWAMNYSGYILRPDRINAAQAGQVIQASLARLYAEGRFLGGFEHTLGELTYIDTNQGDFTRFSGREWIEHAGIRVYELVYHGGTIKD